METKNSQTKIIATLGPATSSKEMLRQMINAGVDVFRLNFSHSTQAEHSKLIHFIHELNAEMEANVSILADLQGPKLRVGIIQDNQLLLQEGDVVTFVTEECIGTKDCIYMTYQEFPEDVNVGESILIDDGKIKLEVIETNKTDKVKARVIYGGMLSSKKGVNLPDTHVSLPCLSEEDISNASFALDNDVDWIGLSFVRKASDVLELKDLIAAKGSHAGVVAKIEKPEALLEIDQIIEHADAIMVARGDLGVEISFAEVPVIQKSIVEKCIRRSKPVIIATQMMESMMENFRPTRAEANDVANAVLDGADALMLSGETSVGKFPVETIRTMQHIISYTESHFHLQNQHDNLPVFAGAMPAYLAASICYNAVRLAKNVGAKAIIAFTTSGYTAVRISSHRTKATIYAFTNNKKLLKRLSLVWGIEAFYIDIYDDLDMAIRKTIEILKDKNLLKEGDCVVHVGSTPLREHGRTNMLKVSIV